MRLSSAVFAFSKILLIKSDSNKELLSILISTNLFGDTNAL